MSIHSIRQYLSEVEKIAHFGGTKKETAIRNAFYNLLNEYAKQKGLMVVPEVSVKGKNGKVVTPDGTLKDILRQDWGYWESKDEYDDLDEEMNKKFAKGYPKDNILFEDSQTAVLIQNSTELMRVSIKNAEALHSLITKFINFERPEVQQFRKAIELFKEDIPKVTLTIRTIILEQEVSNPTFVKASAEFLRLCHESINSSITKDDVREMIIQHVLTEDVFNTIFDETQFHRENNIARELERVILTFFTGSTRRVALSTIQHYYQAINAAAAGIPDHHEKQKFLKVIYETFYKSYNPKAADRLGVVYTPGEVVGFMIRATNYLLFTHFGKFLEDPGVDILDPATGTGTFICDLIDFISKDKLEYKYKNELHANELAILPYYISNLNIEYTYTQKMGKYSEYCNLCFVDTLDNVAGLSQAVTGVHSKYKVMGDLFSITTENSQRIIDQNRRKISVVIGNPPYNANQANENDNNKNREYPTIDKRIRDTFIQKSKAQKTKVYDMYSRFYRWAIDRIDENGIIAFITNRSFIDSKTFDGFRQTIQEEFDFAYIIDTKSDVRANPKIAGTTHNVFGIQTGVAIMFLVKRLSKVKKRVCSIFYVALEDHWRKEQKLQWLAENSIEKISFAHIEPDRNNNWLNITVNDFDSLMPIISKSGENAVFCDYSNGVNTARDEWAYDFDPIVLKRKIAFFCNEFNNSITPIAPIKWSRDLKLKLKRGVKIQSDEIVFKKANYRPFVEKWMAVNGVINDVLSSNVKFFTLQNRAICFNVSGVDLRFFATKLIPDWHFVGDTKCVPIVTVDQSGSEISNVSDWAFNKFIKKYGKRSVTREGIFYYVYGVLHGPEYRNKYGVNLRREFPRVPFYTDFEKWSAWGKRLFDLHTDFHSVEKYELKRVDVVLSDSDMMKYEVFERSKLRANKADGSIEIDGFTTLLNVPPEAWDYFIGGRSAIEWVLDQYKESKLKDSSLSEQFGSYKFVTYKESVIDLLMRVCSVSVQSMGIVRAMIGHEVVF